MPRFWALGLSQVFLRCSREEAKIYIYIFNGVDWILSFSAFRATRIPITDIDIILLHFAALFSFSFILRHLVGSWAAQGGATVLALGSRYYKRFATLQKLLTRRQREAVLEDSFYAVRPLGLYLFTIFLVTVKSSSCKPEQDTSFFFFNFCLYSRFYWPKYCANFRVHLHVYSKLRTAIRRVTFQETLCCLALSFF